ncbi:MAG TPA: acyl-CoA dehydrogenase family protein [Thermoanaerobaculia bacterium]|nr:acyl-CoA dehydrogenase family protein [Thermoanaerobaculia bacterium]
MFNQPPALEGYDLFGMDAALREGVEREGAGWSRSRLERFGRELGRSETLRWGDEANRSGPALRTHDRFGHRVDEVEYHPAWHSLMRLGVEHEVHSLAWTAPQPAGQVARAGLLYLLTQVEAGVGCPLSMTYAGVPALRREPTVAAEWEPKLFSRAYDPRSVPVAEKAGALVGMAMTEKQGGSDVRANTTRALPLDAEAVEAELVGHKWFCSAPMCDAFLTLAFLEEDEREPTCFLVPRFRPDGTKNPILIQRLKDKLGNRSNASSEIEYHGAWARRVGEPGRGIATILGMVQHTRLDCVIASAALMRQALVQAVWHARHRRAFGRLLADQPLMQNVIADLALESEAATVSMLRLARAYDRSSTLPREAAFARLATAALKYWVCKRTPAVVAEALECLGGNGYVEESILPRLYREAPLASIWEGSGNVICLDVLRVLSREPEGAPAVLAELDDAAAAEPRLRPHVEALRCLLAERPDPGQARRLTERLALVLQAALLVGSGQVEVAAAFVATRLDGDHGRALGTLPPGVALGLLADRAWPA